MTEGRHCPLAYRYDPSALCRNPEPVEEDVLYIIGGLYGNPWALDEIERMALAEERQGLRVRLVFNGDFNWFNSSDPLFRAINNRVLAHTASLGNVEYELANPSDGAGCGCGYPDFVDQSVVERSNSIMERLQLVAAGHTDLQQRLSGLPRHRCLLFGGLNILILHGDPESLAGWGLAHESFRAGGAPALPGWFRATGAAVMACSHTCLPVLWKGCVGEQDRIVINNGAAGMGNLERDPRGLVTRIGRSSPGPGALASVESAGVHVSLLPVDFEPGGWLRCFDELWPAGSPASISYRSRILGGTSLARQDMVFSSIF